MKEGITSKLLLSTIFALIVAFAGVTTAYAQERGGRGLTISPLTFELAADPGDSLTNKFKVYNPNDAAVTVNMEMEDFAPVGEEGKVTVAEADDDTYSLKKWVTMEPMEFILEPKGQNFVEFTIAVPENAEPGGKYGSILAVLGASQSAEDGGAAVAISQKVGALLLLTVSGDAKEALSVKEIVVPEFSEYGPVPMGIRFENTGTVHVRPEGTVVVKNWRDTSVAEVPFPQQNVIPGAVRKVEAEFDKENLFGKYSAQVVGTYGEGNIAITDSPVQYFWVMPWKQILIIGGALLLLVIFFYITRRRWGRMFRAFASNDKD